MKGKAKPWLELTPYFIGLVWIYGGPPVSFPLKPMLVPLGIAAKPLMRLPLREFVGNGAIPFHPLVNFWV